MFDAICQNHVALCFVALFSVLDGPVAVPQLLFCWAAADLQEVWVVKALYNRMLFAVIF